MLKDTKVSLVCDGENVSVVSEVMNPFTNQYHGIVKFRGGRWPSGTVCTVSIVSDSLDTEWKYTVKAVDCSKVDMSVNDDGDDGDVDDVDVVMEPETNGEHKGNGKGGKKGLNAGVIAGIVIGCVVVVGAVTFTLVYLLVIRKRKIQTSAIDPDLQV